MLDPNVKPEETEEFVPPVEETQPTEETTTTEETVNEDAVNEG